jgi:hypothetical protein
MEQVRVAVPLEDLLHRSVYLDNVQSRQLAACNARHELVERLARWLLMCDDRVHMGGIFARVAPLATYVHSLSLRDANVNEKHVP